MHKQFFKTTLLVAGILSASLFSFAQQLTEPEHTPAEWFASFPPFRIAGNLYYVGTADLACYLITTPKGNILINTGLAASAAMLKANMEALGFKLKDTKILLTTQAHYDHMGAMAKIKQLTGAQLMVDERDKEVAEDGGRSDYALGGNHSTYQPVAVDRILYNGDVVQLGGMKLVLLNHPGHTKGSCSFVFEVKDKERSYKVLIANMPTIVTDHKFSEVTAYPEIAKDYAYTLSVMKKLTFDIWLSSHASQFNLHSKYKPGNGYRPAAFIDRKGYDKAINELQLAYDQRLSQH